MKYIVNLLVVFSIALIWVIARMETRRLGYVLLREQKMHKRLVDQYREKKVLLANRLRPSHVREYAQNELTLKAAKTNQIIYISGRAFGDHE